MEKRLIGQITVDSGLIAITDPAYLDDGILPDDWETYAEISEDSRGFRLSNASALIVSTVVGDGVFNVYRTDKGILIEI